jgi:hypothetical protein
VSVERIEGTNKHKKQKAKKRSSDLFKSAVNCWDYTASVADEASYGALVE